jgi:hypothetical protein
MEMISYNICLSICFYFMPSVSLFLKFFFSPEENAKHNITFREKLSMEKEKKTEKKKKTKLLTHIKTKQ